MGITLQKLDELRRNGLLAPRCSVLDIGSSNLYSATPDELRAFLSHYNASADAAKLKMMADGSYFGPKGGINCTFVGELMDLCGMSYLSFDIANGYRTMAFDLNSEQVASTLSGSFDLVLNFGTTEHVMNQHNAMRVIHDAAKVGGYIIHEVPCIGFSDHGYVCYTPRFFFDLAGYNEYEVISFSYGTPVDGNELTKLIHDYAGYFPALESFRPIDYQPKDIPLRIVLRKVKAAPFRTPMERSTSVHVD